MIPNTFANQTAPVMNELDQNFAFVAALGTAPCSASGTNAITLTPLATSVAITAYQDLSLYSFAVLTTSTSALTMRVGTLPFLEVFLPSGSQGGVNTFTITDQVIVQYGAALNSGAGGFMIVSAPAIGSPSKMLDQLGAVRGDILYRGAAGWAALAPGTSGFLLASQGAGADPHYISPASASGGYNAVRVTASGNVDFGALFPTATAATRFRVTCVGGGAGGGGVDATNGAKAGGGSSGAWASGVFTGLAGLVVLATIGAGGAAGANTGGAGGTGGATSLGYSSGGNSFTVQTTTSSGGAGSTSATGYTAGGGVGNGAGTVSATGTITLVTTINTFGQTNGGNGLCGTGTTGISGGGGSTPWGAGGAQTTGAGANDGHGFGAGGGGASDSTGAAQIGGAATGGMVLIEAWL